MTATNQNIAQLHVLRVLVEFPFVFAGGIPIQVFAGGISHFLLVAHPNFAL